MSDNNNEDYPRTFEEFIDRFNTEEDCYGYIKKLKWPNGIICPKCHSKKVWKTNRDLYKCSKCAYNISITVNTVFESTRKSLRLWFYVIWFMMVQKTGVSAKNLQESLGFGSYQTIWGWLHKLRSVMIRPGRELLTGKVEVDETYIGASKNGKKGRGSENKILVGVAVEIDNKLLSRVRFRCIKDASANSLIPFIEKNIIKGSEIITDNWNGYNSLNKKGYNHVIHNISKSEKDAVKLLPHVHLVVSLLKRWLRGTHQGAVTSNHLDDYLNEFSFRFNRKKSLYRGKLFYRMMQQAVSTATKGIKDFYVK